MKPHDPKCKDVWKCTKKNCFKRTPDKIVKKEVVDMTPKQVAQVKKNRDILDKINQ
jgi:ribosomal protein L13